MFLSDKRVEAGIPVMDMFTNSHWAAEGRDVTIKVVKQPSGAQKFMSLSNCIALPCYVLFPAYFIGLVSDAQNIGILGVFSAAMSRVYQYGNGLTIFLGHPNFFPIEPDRRRCPSSHIPQWQTSQSCPSELQPEVL